MDSSSERSRRQIFDKYAIKLPDFTSILIWTLGLTIAIYLTIRNFLPLLSEYQNNNVAIEVEVKLLEDKFQPPRVILTIPQEKFRDGEDDDLRVLTRYLFKASFTNTSETDAEGQRMSEKLENVSWDVWNDPNFAHIYFSTLFSLHNDLSLALFHKIMKSSLQEITGIFNDSNSSWNGPIISSIINYIQWQSDSDYLVSIPQFDSTATYMLEPHPDFLEDIIDRDHKLDILFVEVLKVLCKRIRYIESNIFSEFYDPIPTSATCKTLLLQNNDSILLDVTGLWVPLPDLENPSMKHYRFTFTHRNSSQPQKMSNPIVLYASTGSLYCSVIDGDFFSYLHQSPLEQSQYVRQVVTARYKVQMQARETRSDNFQCRNISNVLSCFPECTKQWFIQKCQCIPFNTRKHFDNDLHFPYCNYTSYTTCNITKLPEDIKQNCKATCAAACSYTSYTWQFGYDTSECDPGTSEFILRVIPTFDTFAEFTWTTKNTPEQFFAQLCGVGSFYLGFHGLSLFTALIFLINWWKRFRQKDRSAVQDEWSSQKWAVQSGKWNSFSSKRDQGRNVDQDEEWIMKMKEALRAEIVGDIREQLRAEWRLDIEKSVRWYK